MVDVPAPLVLSAQRVSVSAVSASLGVLQLPKTPAIRTDFPGLGVKETCDVLRSGTHYSGEKLFFLIDFSTTLMLVIMYYTLGAS